MSIHYSITYLIGNLVHFTELYATAGMEEMGEINQISNLIWKMIWQ